MRVIASIVLAIIVMVVQGAAASAEGGAPDKPNAPKVRTGSLSPDEARRADRARKRASAAKVPPTRAAVNQPPQKAPPTAKPPRKALASREPPPRVAPFRAAPVRAAHMHLRPPATDRKRIASKRDDRPTRLRPSRAPTRRVFARRPRRGPEVGDVVPAGVPLYPYRYDYAYPVPPDYGSGQAGAEQGSPEPYPVYEQPAPPFPPTGY